MLAKKFIFLVLQLLNLVRNLKYEGVSRIVKMNY